MATNFYPIGTGETYTTIIGWEAAMSALSSDIEVGVLVDSAEYNEDNIILDAGGTAGSTAYLRLTANDGSIDDSTNGDVRHDGTTGSGARIRGSGPDHVIIVQQSWTVIDHLEIQQDSNQNSDECIRINLANHTRIWVDSCILWTNDTARSDEDGIYNNDTVGDVTVTNTIFIGFQRAGINYYTGSGTSNIYAYFCAFYEVGNGTVEGAFNANGTTGGTQVWAIYNSWAAHKGAAAPFYAASNPTTTLNGSNLVVEHSDDAAGFDTENQTSVTKSATVTTTTQSTGDWIVITTAATDGTEDFQLLDEAAGNALADGGTTSMGTINEARWVTGSSPSNGLGAQGLDMRGYTRHASTPDIGPLEFADAAGGEEAPAGNAPVTVTANTADLALGVNGGNAMPAIDANPGYPDIGSSAGNSAVTATANNATVTVVEFVSAPAGNAAVTATVTDPTTAVTFSAGNAAVTATANDATVSTVSATNAPAGNAAVTATGNDATTAVTVAAGNAAVSAAANDATVTTSTGTEAPAGNAAPSAAANNATIQIGIPAGNAAVTAAATGASVAAGIAAGAVSVAAAAQNGSTALTTAAGNAAVTVAAGDVAVGAPAADRPIRFGDAQVLLELDPAAPVLTFDAASEVLTVDPANPSDT